MAKTLFGIFEVFNDGDRKKIAKSTFRLHVSRSVSEADLSLPLDSDYSLSKKIGSLFVYIRENPSAGVIYERELHVSKEKDRKGHNVFHLKEGPRFFETGCGETFPFMLVEFLQGGISLT